jgi:hypothetical protein
MASGQRREAPRTLQMKDAKNIHAAFSRNLTALTMRIMGRALLMRERLRLGARFDVGERRCAHAAQQPSDFRLS